MKDWQEIINDLIKNPDIKSVEIKGWESHDLSGHGYIKKHLPIIRIEKYDCYNRKSKESITSS